MKEKKTITNGFVWVPMNKRTGKFGLPMPPRPAETRKPLLWLARNGNELYFVNSSDETIDLILADTGGFQTVDDDVMTISSDSAYEYQNVLPGDAVKVEEFDGFYDLDFVLQVVIKLKSKKFGSIEIITPAKKGGIGEIVLLWDTGKWTCHYKPCEIIRS